MSSFPLNNSWQNVNSGSFFPPALPLPNSTASTNALAMQVLNQGSFHVPSFQFIQPLSMSDIFAPLVPLPLFFQNVNSDHNGPLNPQAAPEQPLPLLHTPSVPLPPFFHSVNTEHNGLLNPQVLPILNASFTVPNQPLVQPAPSPSPDSNRMISGQQAVRYIWDQAANGAPQNGEDLQDRSGPPVLAQVVPSSSPEDSQELPPFASELAAENVPPSEKRKRVKVFRKKTEGTRRGAPRIYEVSNIETQEKLNSDTLVISELLNGYKERALEILKKNPRYSQKEEIASPISAAGFNFATGKLHFLIKKPEESKYRHIGKGRFTQFLGELEGIDPELFALTKDFFSSLLRIRRNYSSQIIGNRKRSDQSVDFLLSRARSSKREGKDPELKRFCSQKNEKMREALENCFDCWKREEGKSFPEKFITRIEGSIVIGSKGRILSFVHYKVIGYSRALSVNQVKNIIELEYKERYIDIASLFSVLNEKLEKIKSDHANLFNEALKNIRLANASNASSSSAAAAPSQPNPN